MTELPQNWRSCSITEICNVYQPKTIATSQLISDGKYPVFGANGQIGFYNEYNHENPEVLITCRGATCGSINKSKKKSWINGNAMVASSLDANTLDKDYLFFFLKSISFKDYITGSAQPQITRTSLEKLNVIFPLIDEQKQIVKKLNAVIPRVDEVNSRLERIPLILKLARQSILNQAVKGELTKDWRKGHSATWTTESLINKINTELSNLLLEKKILKENSKISSENIEKINDNNWYRIKARYLCHHITKGTTPKKMTEIGDIPYLKVYNIVNNKIDFEYKPQFVSNEIHNNFLARSKVYPDDVLMNIVGPPLGKIAIVPNSYAEWNINQAIAFFRPIKYLLSEYLYLTLCCESTLLDVLPDTKGIVGQSNISLEQCRDLQILLPPVEEQTEIVKRVKEAFEKLDKIEEQYKKAKSYTDKLTQSILHKAFKGDLVPQDPNDKPIKLSE